MATEGEGSRPSQSDETSERLDSWKEIAAYLGREVRTVQRWEAGEGMPVHRHAHAQRGTVYAYKSELDRWLEGRDAAEVAPMPGAATAEKPVPRTAQAEAGKRVVLGIAAMVLLAFALIVAVRLAHAGRQGAVAAPKPGIAVLTFETIPAGSSNAILSAGLSDDLITDLGQAGQVPVISRTSSAQFQIGREPLPQIAQDLHVGLVIEGTIERSGNRVRITAQLVEARTDHPVWSGKYEDTYTDLLSLQDDVAGEIATAVLVKLGVSTAGRLEVIAPASPSARLAYLTGEFLADRRDRASLERAAAYFKKSLAQDPNYAPAYAGLADVYGLLSGWGDLPAADSFQKAEAAAREALALDDSDAEAHAALGLARTYYNWDFQGAGEEFRRAIQLNPANADAHHWYAYTSLLRGRANRAIREIKIAEALDPRSLIVSSDVAEVLFLSGHDRQATAQALRVLKMNPGFMQAHVTLGLVYLQQSEPRRAIEELGRAVALSGSAPVDVATLGYAYAVSGQRRKALRVLAELRRMSESHHVNGERFALVYAGLGMDTEAIQWFRAAYAEHDRSEFCSAKMLPEFDSLRTDPRFLAFLRSIDFPQ